VSNDAVLEELNKIESNYLLRDPETAPAELQRIVEDEMGRAGINVDDIREKKRAQSERERKAIFAAPATFRASRPESDSVNGFLPCEANETLMLEHMQRHGLDFTLPYSYEEAFLAIRDRLLSPKQSRATSRVRKVDGIEITHRLFGPALCARFGTAAAKPSNHGSRECFAAPSLKRSFQLRQS
jgi:hypothetical protein